MNSINIIPMAGYGRRFSSLGYKLPKPLLLVNSKPMFITATNCLPKADKNIFIYQSIFEKNFNIQKIINNHYRNNISLKVDYDTGGQACTCLKANDYLIDNQIISIGPCDSYFDYNQIEFKNKISKADLLVWTFKDKITSVKPEMYGWVKLTSKGIVERIICKEPISDNPSNDNALVGAFSFKNRSVFLNSINSVLKKNRRIKNEYYLDTVADEAILLGYKVDFINTKTFYSFGTPVDYEKNKNFNSAEK